METFIPAIPVALAAFALGFLAIYTTRQRRRGRGTVASWRRRSSPARRATTPPLAHPVAQPSEPTVASSRPTHTVGRIQIPKIEPAVQGTGDVNISVGAPTGTPICPYCLNPISEADLVLCPQCQTAHHRACWESQEGCSMFACSQRPRKSS